MLGNSQTEPLTFGFDIGIASVGWAVLSPTRIVNLGVRCFDKAETAKEGEPLNLTRRNARLMRRRLYRRAWRLTKLAKLLKRHGLIDDIKTLKQPPSKGFHTPHLWRLRIEALNRQLSAEEWARVIYHLCKHRGFHWISRAEEKQAEGDSNSEGGKVKRGLNATAQRMSNHNYRTAAEMVLSEFPTAQRNKRGDYGKALPRKLLAEELSTLFKTQRQLGNPHADLELEQAILGNGDRKSGLFWEQKPPLSGANLLKMLGKCTFERGEYRAPKASFTAERHVWLTRLNNLRITLDGVTRALNDEERRIALPLPYQYASDLRYKQLKDALINAALLPESVRFAGLSYPSDRQKSEDKAKDPEADTLIKMPALYKLRKLLKDKGLETEWEAMKSVALGGSPQQLDDIAWVLSVYKDGDEVERELRKLTLPGGEPMVQALLEISFEKFHALSLKALRNIVPPMERGLRYDEACTEAGYHHSQLLIKTGDGKTRYLPPFYSNRDKSGRMVFDENLDIPRNPVVLRALNQARKVCNALIREYGSPHAVHIEMARDLSRPMDERSKIKKLQEDFQARNKHDRETFAKDFGIDAGSREFERYQLYREQQGKCAYSLEPLDLDRVLHEQGYAEVDHALPYSRSFDDSKNNRVLALTRENRNKCNRTPFEYLNSISEERWRTFAAWVESNKLYRQAKRSRLLRKDFGGNEAEGFRDRNLNDTRYICRFFKNYVEQYLQLADDSKNKRCVVVNGQLTAFLRRRWGLIKVRDDSDRHHALDAAVVAACNHSMVKRLADYSRRKLLEHAREGFVDVETGEVVNPCMLDQLEAHFPTPWPHFRQEAEVRLNTDSPDQLRNRTAIFGTYPEQAIQSLRPLFVSRAPQRRNGGAAHKDTIYAQPKSLKEQGGVTQKVSLASLTIKDMDKLMDPHRNQKLYAAIRARLEQFGGKGDKAFTPDNPLHKPDKDGNPTGPIVGSVTVVIDKLSGIPIRGGLAKNDSMLRVDVFSKNAKFFLVPVYVYHRVARELPNLGIVAHKEEDEWTQIDGSFAFCFSMYPNDLIRITQKQGTFIGYYAGCDRGSGNINLWSHDRKKSVGKDGLIRGIGAKTALSIDKFNVDVLGNIYPAPKEERRGLA